MKHSPTPWNTETRDERGNDYGQPITVVNAQGRCVAYHSEPGTFLKPEDAAHICLCVNAHEELVGALQSVLEDLEKADLKRTLEDYNFAAYHALATVRNALSKLP